MKKVILLCGALLALTATVASAGGLNLAWNNCLGEGTPVLNKNYACTSNAGTDIAVASFIPTMTSATVNGNELVFDLQSSGATLPAWWQFFNPGTCRSTSLSIDAAANANNVVCIDEFAGQATTGIGAYVIGFGGANRARIKIAEAVPATALASVDPTGEYFSLNLKINHLKTGGATACAGCSTPVCIVLNSIKLTAGGGDLDEFIGNAAVSNYVTWQGGAIGAGGCPAATPTHNTTWGAVKSLYR
jgi:hypothetical protein